MNRSAVITVDNIVRGVYEWDGDTFIPPPYAPVDVYGVPTADSQPTTAVPDTDPPTAQIGYTYNPADGTFTAPAAQAPAAQAPATQPGLISRVLSALNPFK